MANTLKFGNENWATKKDSILAYNDENANFKPLPFVTSRASTATRVNKAGLLETVASGIPRVDYLGNTKGAYLLEPQSTNLIAQSESFGNSYWTKSGASIQGDASTVGNEKVVNGDFATTSNWVLAGESVISGGRGIVYSSAGAFSNIKQLGILTVGKNYILKFDILTETSGYIKIGSSNGGSDITANVSSVGSYTYHFNAVDTLISFARGGSITHIYIDNVSIKEVSGFVSPSADSPLGAFKLVESSANSVHTIRAQETTISGVAYTFSLLAKADGRDFIKMRLENAAGSGQANVWFDVKNGVVGTIGSGTAKIELISNGWYRCSITGTTSGTSYLSRVYLSDADGSDSYTGNGTSGVYIFGAQLEQKSYPTSYIPTNGSTVTRLAESCSQTPPDGVIGQTEGTMFIDVTGETQVDAARYITIGNIGDTTNRLIIYQYSNLINVFSGAGATFNITYNPPSGRLKMALAYSVGDYAFYVNGVQVFTNDNNAVPACSEVSLGMNEITSAILAPSIGYNDVGLYNTRLSNTELVTLTTI